MFKNEYLKYNKKDLKSLKKNNKYVFNTLAAKNKFDSPNFAMVLIGCELHLIEEALKTKKN